MTEVLQEAHQDTTVDGTEVDETLMPAERLAVRVVLALADAQDLNVLTQG
jgi:hypothetical protein